VAIAKRVADALPPLTAEQVYQGVDYSRKGVDFTIALPGFRVPGKVDVLKKTVIDQVCTNYGHVLSVFFPGDRHATRSLLCSDCAQFQADDFVESVTHNKGVPALHAEDSLPCPRPARAKSGHRILITEHRQELPCRPLPLDDYCGKFVQGLWVASRANELSRRLGHASTSVLQCSISFLFYLFYSGLIVIGFEKDAESDPGV
jgi:hypothetical protein